jgi:hypothetical protein
MTHSLWALARGLRPRKRPAVLDRDKGEKALLPSC